MTIQPILGMVIGWAAGAVALSAMAGTNTILVPVRSNSQAPGYEGYRAMDGNPNTLWHTDWQLENPSHPHELAIDLGAPYEIGGFVYLPRPGGGNGTIARYEFYVGDANDQPGALVMAGTFAHQDRENVVLFPSKVTGQHVRLRALSEVRGQRWASAAGLRLLVDGIEFRAHPTFSSPWHHADGTRKNEREREHVALARDLQRSQHFAHVAPETFHPAALIDKQDRDPTDVVLRRTEALLTDLQGMTAAGHLASLAAELAALRTVGETLDPTERAARYALFEQVCELRRRIAFANPLLDFDQLLFIKRHRATFDHMCDQYYGINANPGGELHLRVPEGVQQANETVTDFPGSGLFILEDPFGPNPIARNVLADSTVQRGRLEGQRLEGGSFLSPDLSYDGERILFAYVEGRGDRSHEYHTDPTRGHWSPGWSYHIFKVNVDGSGLERLTDGTWNDFDPIWLPNGRIAFISERRGGYLRCGRVCPNYTLFDMAADGSDISCLSFHETNEWHPSVTHDGRIIWTRWDYVDRHGVTAHTPWITTLDGRDPRPVYGNYATRHLRPDMILDVRAIPGSHRFVGTAAPHHGQAFGSLILLDPWVPDDDRTAPLKRLTPEEGFPETQGGAHSYGNPWPLNDHYYLCVYDVGMSDPTLGFQGGRYVRGDYGLYLVDVFGNRELLYRDPNISSQSPIPLRPRPVPPVMPETIQRNPDTVPAVRPPVGHEEISATATVSVMNVYESLLPWPEATRIRELRVVQVFPMSVPSGEPPHETGIRIAGAGDSVVPVRHVLGTVPVESDGSAHFTVPAHRSIFFQALDEEGLAVQSMRSSTYLREAEHLSCVGCHEPGHRAPLFTFQPPLALRRPPSELKPDVEGSRPFSYARLVQPVLDRNCVSCHQENPGTAPNLGREPITRNWFASYHSLAPHYGFHDYGDPYRTTPGQFGARASKLYTLLVGDHHGLELTPDDLQRLTLWLDLCSMFYGVYEQEQGEAQLRGEVAWPTLE
jgi:hypothetical protein